MICAFLPNKEQHFLINTEATRTENAFFYFHGTRNAVFCTLVTYLHPRKKKVLEVENVPPLSSILHLVLLQK